MEENLMEPQDMASLGFSENKQCDKDKKKQQTIGDSTTQEEQIHGYDRKREKQGFVSGSGVRSKLGSWFRNPFQSRDE